MGKIIVQEITFKLRVTGVIDHRLNAKSILEKLGIEGYASIVLNTFR